jgi:tape measure domain-containing protein
MAMTDMQRLIVSLEARTAAFEKAMNRANGVANKRARAIEGRFMQMNRKISASMAGIGRGFIGGIAAGIGAREVGQLLDSATRIDNALKVAGLSGAELEGVYSRLRDSAVANAAPLESLVELYGRAALVQKELGISGEELLGFTDKIAVALRVSGKSAAESSGALLQLSQALGSGVVRAEEFNSILEGALPIAQAAAAGLLEAGGSVAKLRQLVVDGKVSSEAFFRAFEAGAPMLEDKVASAVLTIDQRISNLKTALIDAARRFNTSTQAANTFGEAIDNVSDFVNSVDFESLISEISDIIEAFRQGIQAANNFAAAISQASGLENVGEFITGGKVSVEPVPGLKITSQKALRERIDSAFDVAETAVDQAVVDAVKARYGSEVAPKGGRVGASKAFTPVSLSQFAAPDGKGKGGGGKSKRENELEREIAQIKERTAAVTAETAAMAGLNPLIDDYGFALEKARAVHELLTAAQKAGITVTPELRAQIEGLATAYASAEVEANKLAESQEKTRQAAEEFNALGKEVLGGFITDLRNGTSAAEALQNALGKIADKLLDIALSSLFSGSGGGGFNFLKLFGFAEGGIAAHGKPLRKFARGGVSKTAAVFGEAGPEAAVPLPDGRRIPVDLRLPQKVEQRQTGSTTISMPVNISAPGADAAALGRVREQVQELQKSLPSQVKAIIHRQQVRGY